MPEIFDLPGYDELVDPDEADHGGGAAFTWGEEYQRDVLAMLLADRSFLSSTASLIKPSYFTNKAHKEICRILFGYFQKYKKPPTKSVIIKEMSGKFKDDEAKFFYLGVLNSLYDAYQPGLDSVEYNLENILHFTKMQRVKEAWANSLRVIESGEVGDATWDRVGKFWQDALAVKLDLGVGLKYFSTIEERYEDMLKASEVVELFTTGFKKLDDALTNGGMKRGELISVMALPGVGKSLALCRMAVANVLRGKKVLFISCEMKQDDIAVRFDAQFAHHNIRTLYENKDKVIPLIKKVVQDQPENERDRLIVKWYPSGTVDVNTLRAYHQQLKMTGFEPDLVIIDYLGEMKDYVGMKLYESRELLVKDIVGWIGEEDICGATAMQPNRSAREAQQDHVLDDNHLGDAFGQSRPLHAFYSLNQRDDEKAQGVGRLFIIKLRNGKSRFQFYLQWDDETLQINEISEERYRARLNDYKEVVAEDVQMPEFFGKKKKKSRLVDDEPEPE